MKPPLGPRRRPGRPAAQAGQPRGSLSGSAGSVGKKCGPRSRSSASITSVIERSLAPATEVLKASQKSRSTRRQSTRPPEMRSEEHTSELQSLMRSSYAVFCLKKKKDIDEAECDKY